MQEEEKPEEALIIIHQSYLWSLLSDTTTFGFIIFIYYANQEFLNSSVPQWLLGGVFFIYLTARLPFFKKFVFTDKAKAQEFIDKFYS